MELLLKYLYIHIYLVLLPDFSTVLCDVLREQMSHYVQVKAVKKSVEDDVSIEAEPMKCILSKHKMMLLCIL